MREAERQEAEREERLRVARALGVLLRSVAEPGQFLRRLANGDDAAALERVRVWTMAENPGIVQDAALVLRGWWNRPVEVGEWDYGEERARIEVRTFGGLVATAELWALSLALSALTAGEVVGMGRAHARPLPSEMPEAFGVCARCGRFGRKFGHPREGVAAKWAAKLRLGPLPLLAPVDDGREWRCEDCFPVED